MGTVVNVGPDPSIAKRHICNHCSAVLEYAPKDIQTRTVTDYIGDSDTVYYIECPQCNDKQTIKRT